MTKQPWIYSARLDGAFILAPAFAISAAVLVFHRFFSGHQVSPWMWGLLVVGVDVAHVYSTLYRTYFDGHEFRRQRALYLTVPVVGWLAAAALYSLGPMVFWRVLAYLAVFHFMRQQYGFMMIYGRREGPHRRLDKTAIYLATLYPLLYWHTNGRHFSWFMDGDFLSLPLPWLGRLGLVAYCAVMLAYIVKEGRLWRAGSGFNWPRNLLLGGTALSWGVGIVVFDSDLAFTATNVLAHGIPYMALIWVYGRNESRIAPKTLLGMVPSRHVFSPWFLPLFAGLLILLAYLEEGLWDGFVWTEHRGLFPAFASLPAIDDNDILTWLVPLLALPQITHYLLDAFIWRRSWAGGVSSRILLHNVSRASS